VYSVRASFLRKLAAALFIATTAQAQPSDPSPSPAERLFEEGKSLLQKEQVDEACDKLQESQSLEPAVGTLGLLGYCRELQGRTATAWRNYLESAEMAHAAGDKKREKVARERAAALEDKLSRIKIVVSDPVPGLMVSHGDRQIASSEWADGVVTDPGSVEVSAKAPGYRPWLVQIDLPAGSSLTIRVPALEPASAEPEEEGTVAHLSTSDDSTTGLIPGIAVAGAGAVFLGVGTYFGLRAFKKNDASEEHCVNNVCDAKGGELRDQAKTAATISNVTIGLGLVGAGIGTYLIATNLKRDSQAPQGARLVVEPEFGPQGASLGVRGVF
jgi:hypothetical protein